MRPENPRSSKTSASKPKIGVVIGSGGIKSLAVVELFKMLDAQGIDIDLMVGCSGGGILGALRGCGHNADEIAGFVKQFWNRHLFSQVDFKTFLNIFQMPWPRFSKDRALLKPHLMQGALRSFFKDRRLEDLRPKIILQATDADTGEGVILSEGNVAEALYASGAQFPFLPPAKIGNQWLADGGFSSSLPILEAVRRGMDVIIAFAVEQTGVESQSFFDFCVNFFSRTYTVNVRSQTALAVDLHHHEIIIVNVHFGEVINMWNVEKIPQILEAGQQAVAEKQGDILTAIEHFSREQSLMGLKNKIILVFSLFSFLAIGVFTYSAVRLRGESFMREVDRTLMCAAITGSNLFGGEFHDRILDRNSVSPAEHLQNTLALSKVAKLLKVHYLYHMIEASGTIVFTTTSALDNEIASSSFDPFFAPYPDHSLNLEKALRENRIYFENYRDKFGHFRSVFYPATTPKGKTFVVGADITIEDIREHLQDMMLTFVGRGLLMYLLSLLVAIPLLNRISRDFVQVGKFATNLADMQFKTTPETLAGLEVLAAGQQDETGDVARSLLAMERALQKHFQELKQTIADKEKIGSEMRIAQEIQQGILPKVFPPFPECPTVEIYAELRPTREVGGDFYDFFPLENDRLLITIGDVSGKGVPASFFMAMTVTLLKSIARQGYSSVEILRQVNQNLVRDNESSMFVTVFCGILNLRTGELEYTNAGHNPPLLIRENGTLTLESGGLVLGAKEKPHLKSGHVTLKVGETLFLYTDGITEAANSNGELFSDLRLRRELEKHGSRSAVELVRLLLTDIRYFAQYGPQSDDIAVMAVRFLGRRGQSTRSDNKTNISIVNNKSELDKVTQGITSFWEQRGFPRETLSNVQLMTEEIVINIIAHAFPEGDSHEIQVRLFDQGKSVVIEIEDDGVPFDPLSLPAPQLDLSVAERPVGGLGIHLVKELANSFQYERNGRKNLIRIAKKIAL